MKTSKLPCKNCICLAICKSKKTLSSIVIGCEILEGMWLSTNYENSIEFFDEIRGTFNKI